MTNHAASEIRFLRGGCAKTIRNHYRKRKEGENCFARVYDEESAREGVATRWGGGEME